MDRRRFLSLFSAAAAGLVAAPAIPFGRVWSFPSKIVIPKIVRLEFTHGVDLATNDQGFTVRTEWKRECDGRIYKRDTLLQPSGIWDVLSEWRPTPDLHVPVYEFGTVFCDARQLRQVLELTGADGPRAIPAAHQVDRL